MRLSLTAAVFVFVSAFFCTGVSTADTMVTIDGAPVTGAMVGSTTGFIGYPKLLTVAPLLGQTSDASSATVTSFDLGIHPIDAGAASNDPSGKVLLVWVWLLPISGVLCIVAYVIVIGQMNRSWAAAAARRGKPVKNTGLLV